MGNTYCKNCLFNNNHNCDLDIYSYIPEKEIVSIEGDRYIKNYTCNYAMSKNVIDKISKATIKEIQDYIISVNCLKYYLILNIEDIKHLETNIDMINALNIKPKNVSFLINIENDHQNILRSMTKLDKSIKWKTHAYISGSTSSNNFYERANIAAETNLDCDMDYIIFYCLNDEVEDLNHLLEYYQKEIKIRKTTAHGLCYKKDMLNGYILPVNIYKQIITNVNRNICQAVNTEIDGFILKPYEKS